MALCIYTIGHSTRSIEDFLDLLREHGVASIVDVRRFPGSRRHPQFSQDALSASLAASGIGYVHKVELGGRRSGGQGSANTAWRNASFRAYADYMGTPAFSAALRFLIDHASRQRTGLLCAEALPQRCHRRLIADALVIQGTEVIHILGPRRSEPHQLNPYAKAIEGGGLVYPEPGPHQVMLEFAGNSMASASMPRHGR